MKKRILFQFMAVLLALTLALNPFGAVSVRAEESAVSTKAVKSVKITNISSGYVLPAKKSVTLKVKTSPSVSVKKLTFSSSNEKVASVSGSGKITAKKNGTATIMVRSKDSPKVKTTVKIHVGKRVSKLSFSKYPANKILRKGASFTMGVTVSPSKAANKKLAWSSSDKSVLTVSSAGKIKAVGTGTAKITAAAKDGSGKKVGMKITVKEAAASVSIGHTMKSYRSAAAILKGQQTKLSAAVDPSGAWQKVKWSSSDKSILTVDAGGMVTAVSEGTATVTAAAADGSGKKAVLTITVYSPAESITIRSGRTYPYAKVGETLSFSADVSPNSAMQDLIWTSTDSTVASVEQDGTVHARSSGQAVITAAATDGSGVTENYTLTVNNPGTAAAFTIAHRGYSALAPENTVAAYQLAADSDFDGIECDVWTTSDGVFVLSHDNSLNRIYDSRNVTGKTKNVTSSTYDEIKGLVAVGGNGADVYTNEHIPTLDDYMAIIAASDKTAIIELKQGDQNQTGYPVWDQETTNRLYDKVASYGINDRVEIISFYSNLLLQIQTAAATYSERHASPQGSDTDDPLGGSGGIDSGEVSLGRAAAGYEPADEVIEDELIEEAAEADEYELMQEAAAGYEPADEAIEDELIEEAAEADEYELMQEAAAGYELTDEAVETDFEDELSEADPADAPVEELIEESAAETFADELPEAAEEDTQPEDTAEDILLEETDETEDQEGAFAETDPPSVPPLPKLSLLTSTPLLIFSDLGFKDAVDWAAEHDCGLSVNYVFATPELVERARRLGIRFSVWTVNDYSTACYFSEVLAVDAITSNLYLFN